MKVILRDDIPEVGKRGDMVEVADGHARNYLLPKGLAMRATVSNQVQAEAMRKAREARDSRDREAAQEIATRLVPTVIHIVARADEKGTLFGSITEDQIVSAVKDQTGVELDRRIILIDEHIKAVGTHYVMARVHNDVQFPITLEIDTV